jgi:HK97 family phage major capsid protein
MAAVYNALVDRAESQALMPEEVRRDIIDGMVEKSLVLSRLERQRMSRMQTRMPILDRLPTAYFVNGDTGLKGTTDQAWTNLYLTAEEVAVLVPIPNNVLRDADYDLYSLIKPRLTEAAGALVDGAVLFGTNKPATWPNGIMQGAAAAGNTITAGAVAGEDIYSDLNLVMAKLEADGYNGDLWVIRPEFQAIVRNARDAQKGFLYPAGGPANTGGADATRQVGEIWGIPTYVSRMGLAGFATGATNPTAFLLDTDHLVVGIREDLEFEVFKAGVISDAAGVVLMNLIQQDTTALRMTFRVAWQALNPVSRQQTNRANAYPAAVLLQGTVAATLEGGSEQTPALTGESQPALTEAAAAPSVTPTRRTTTAERER